MIKKKREEEERKLELHAGDEWFLRTDGVSSFYSFIRDWTVSAFCGSPRKKCVGRDVGKMFPYSWKETGYTKAWMEGRRRTRVHHRCCAPCFSSSLAFPNLKVVSHVERKKARVPSDIFYRIPSPCPLSISLSRLIYSTRYTPLPSAFPQLKTFDFPRRNLSSKKIIRANVSVFFPFRWLTIREFSC